jgi:hypothetical protein
MAEVIQELGIELTLAKDLLAPWLAIDLTQETSCVSHQRPDHTPVLYRPFRVEMRYVPSWPSNGFVMVSLPLLWIFNFTV